MLIYDGERVGERFRNRELGDEKGSEIRDSGRKRFKNRELGKKKV